MQNWYSHEEYMRLLNQSRLLAEQRSQLEGPFWTTSQTAPGGGSNAEQPQGEPYKLSLTYEVTDLSLNKPYIQIVISEGAEQVISFNWGDGDETDVTLVPSVLNTINSKSYSSIGTYSVEVSIPDPQRFTALYIYDKYTAPSLSSIAGMTGPILGENLQFIDFRTNTLDSIDLSGLIGLKSLSLNENQFVTMDLSRASSTIELYGLKDNFSLTDITLGSLSSCSAFDASNCALNSSTVDSIIDTLASTGTMTDGTLNLSGGSNAAPTGAVSTALDTLISLRNWSITTN